jgi:cell division protein YceG involved in septum cleavage
MRRLIRIVFVLFLVALGAAAVIVWRSNAWLQTPIEALQQPTLFEVPRGASLRAVATDLNQKGLLDQPRVWIVWARLMG